MTIDQMTTQLQTALARLQEDYDTLQAEHEKALMALATLQALKYSSLRLTGAMDLKQMLEDILAVIFELMPATDAQVFLYVGEELFFGARVTDGRSYEQPITPPRKHGITYTAAVTGETVIVEDLRHHPLFEGRENATSPLLAGALIGVPLKIGPHVAGVMIVGFEEPRSFTQQEIDIAELFGMQAAIAIENARLYKQSQQNAAEVEAKRQQDRLYYEELNRTKDMLMDMLSHDLRNPINVIKGFVYILRQHGRLDDELGRDALDTIQRGADQMAELLKDLLDLAKLETGLALTLETVSLNHLLEKISDENQAAARQKNIILSSGRSTPDVEFAVDLRRMRQVLANLVSNAIKYTQDGGHVDMEGMYTDDRIKIVVRDNGFGIPESDLPRLFEKFYRVKSGAHAEVDGTGLGLAIVKEIVEQHGGLIQVESTLGVGSTFTIDLPRR